MKEIGVGLIGYGAMGKAHTYGYKTLPLYYSNLPFKVKLVGVCCGHLENAQKAKEEMGYEYATDNIDDILSREDIQVVNICTPNNMHKDMIIKALKAGKHIYCDKPMVISSREAGEVLQELKKTTVFNQVAFHNRFFPAIIRAKQIIEEGRLGKILTYRAVYLHSGSVDPNKPIGWKQDKSIGGGGVLFDLGSHVLDLMYYLMGEYESIMAKTQVAYAKRCDKNGCMVDIEAEDMAIMIAKMQNGALGTIEASKVSTGTNDELRFELHGQKGALKFDLMNPNWLEFYDNTLPEQDFGGCKGYTKIECVQRYEKPGGSFPAHKVSIGWMRGHVHCLYNFLSCVYEGHEASPSFVEAAYIQHVMEKAYESDSLGRWVEI
ncbi:MAG TPA: Gfo/Idh/MocA family oxidoreductase [Patescibacteria group bacterium]|nr:Gfo/Idh/MocA family oxidoreductase [Patescibacteria group bacterium]